MVFGQIIKSCRPQSNKADKDFGENLILKSQIFLSKLETFIKSEKRNPSALAFLVMKIRKISNLYIKKLLRRKTFWLIIDRRSRKEIPCSYQWFQYVYVWSFITSRKETYLPLQKKFWSVILKIDLKLMLIKRLRWLKKVNMLNSKILKEK